MKPGAYSHHFGVIQIIGILLVEYAELQASLSRNKQIIMLKRIENEELHRKL